jgi:hypothetical protein
VQKEGLIRTAKESQPTRGTHQLSSPDRGIGQDSERKPVSEEHSPPVEPRAKGKSGQQMKVSEQRALTGSIAEGRTSQDNERKLVSERHSLSASREGPVSERKPVSKGHSHPDEHKRKDSSGRRKKASKSGTLTSCRAQRGRGIRTANEGQRVRGAHQLSGRGMN